MTFSLCLQWILFLEVLSFFFFPSASLFSAENVHYGKVVGVTDGDTIEILEQEETLKIRLAEIDAPETRQAFGTQAKKALSGLVFSKEVQCA